MKKFLAISTLAFLFATSQVVSQGTSLVVFSEKGEKFILEVNGTRQNSKPESRVSVEGLSGPMVKMKVFMDETGNPPVSKSVMNKTNADFYYLIEKDAKGKYILKSTSSDQSGGVKEDNGKKVENGESKAATGKANKEEGKSDPGKGKEKAGSCESPISDGDFYSSIASISHAPFDAPKLNSAKNLSRSKCLSADQVRQVIYIFDGEKTKLEYAKYAYEYVYDPKNYDEVYDALRSKSVEDLKKFIETK